MNHYVISTIALFLFLIFGIGYWIGDSIGGNCYVTPTTERIIQEKCKCYCPEINCTTCEEPSMEYCLERIEEVKKFKQRLESLK